MEDLTLIVCQPAPDSVNGMTTEKIHRVSSAELNQCLLEATTEFAAIASGPLVPSPEEFRQSCDLLQSDPNLKLVLHFPQSNKHAAFAWQNFPARLAALRENPALKMGSLVIKLCDGKQMGFRDVSEPIWDFLIRLSSTPGTIQTQILANGDENSRGHQEYPGLAPQPPGRSLNWLHSHLQDFSLAGFHSKVTSPPDAIALKAGLFQIHDYLDASHELSQSIEGQGRRADGDYWHAIMHRREPDYSNAKYWFRHVGSHPIFAALAEAVDGILSQAETASAQTARQ
jgi:hypothetical protein